MIFSRSFATALALLFAAAVPCSYADGIAFVEKEIAVSGAAISQKAQQAVLVWDDGVETLHLQSNYSGPAENLCWVIPVPSRPKVKRSKWELFRVAEEMTRPRVILVKMARSEKCCCCLSPACSAPPLEEEEPAHPGVTTLESLDIRELHVDILSARDGRGFIRWLNDNGYAVPEQAVEILGEYIEKDFFFIAVKIRKQSFWAFIKGADKNVDSGLTPLAITFETRKPFYPLKISSVTSAPKNELFLMTIASDRLSPVEYAETELTAKDIKKGLGAELLGSSSLDTPDFGPAVREAQKRIGGNAFVVESAITKKWDRTSENENSFLADEAAGDTVFITRFHAFLTPGEMRDATFRPSEKQKAMPGTFRIQLAEILRMAAFPLDLLLILACMFLMRDNGVIRKYILYPFVKSR